MRMGTLINGTVSQTDSGLDPMWRASETQLSVDQRQLYLDLELPNLQDFGKQLLSHPNYGVLLRRLERMNSAKGLLQIEMIITAQA